MGNYSTVKGGGKLLNIINDLPQECDVMTITSDTCGRLFFQKNQSACMKSGSKLERRLTTNKNNTPPP